MSGEEIGKLRGELEEQRRLTLQLATDLEVEKVRHEDTKGKLAAAMVEAQQLAKKAKDREANLLEDPFTLTANMLELQQRVAELEIELVKTKETWQSDRELWDAERQLLILQQQQQQQQALTIKDSRDSGSATKDQLRMSLRIPSSDSISSMAAATSSGPPPPSSVKDSAGFLASLAAPGVSSGGSGSGGSIRGIDRPTIVVAPSPHSSYVSSPVSSPRGSVSSFHNFAIQQAGEARIPAGFVPLLQEHFQDLQLFVKEQESRFYDCEQYVLRSHAAKYIRYAGVVLRERQLTVMIEDLEHDGNELKTRSLSIAGSPSLQVFF